MHCNLLLQVKKLQLGDEPPSEAQLLASGVRRVVHKLLKKPLVPKGRYLTPCSNLHMKLHDLLAEKAYVIHVQVEVELGCHHQSTILPSTPGPMPGISGPAIHPHPMQGVDIRPGHSYPPCAG